MRRGTTRAKREGWVVEVDDQRSDSCVELHPGEVLVWIRSSGRWVTCSAEQLGAWFEPAPRELPIYSDGEIAE